MTATPESADLANRDKRGLLGAALRALSHAGFVQNATPVEGLLSMQRAWQGPDEDLVIVDVITIDGQDQALAVREGSDGVPVWGPERGSWLDIVAVFVKLPPPDEFVLVSANRPSLPMTGLPGGLS